MNIKTIIKYILIAIPLLFLAKFGIEKVIYDSNKIPDVNPNPKEKVRIYGKFPLNSSKYYIKVFIQYFASNPKCDTQVRLAGTSFSQEVFKELNATMLDDGYEVIIYDDYYKRGVCNWKIENINFNILSKDTNQASYHVGFTTYIKIPSDDTPKAKSPVNFICDNEYLSSTNYTRYYCEDSVQNIITYPKSILISNLSKEFEVNFNQITEPIAKTKKGGK